MMILKNVFKCLVLSACVLAFNYAYADVKEGGLKFLYIQNLAKGYIQAPAGNNTNNEMKLVAKLSKDNTISFTNSRDVKLGGEIASDKFVEVFNKAAKDKGLNAALIINLPKHKSYYYIVSLKNAKYNSQTKQISYDIKVVQAAGGVKNTGKVSFNGGTLFIDDICLECVLN